MARGKRRKGRKDKRIDPTDVLEGRSRVDVRQLIELIRRVNPTDRRMSSKEEARRYLVKSRLQDQLVERFSDELEVEAGTEGVVLFRLGPGGPSACHARIDELGEPTRRWVRRTLDEQEAAGQMSGAADEAPGGAGVAGPQPEAETGAAEVGVHDESALEKLAPAALIEQGAAALVAYEYDGARACFEEAFTRSSGSAAAARPLLELLVDRLALYPEARALSAELSEEAARDPEIRVLLGKAAAQMTDAGAATSKATSLIRGLEGPKVAEVYLALARRAVSDERDADVEGHLQAARRHEGARDEIHQLEQELEALRARRWRSAEEEIERAFELGDLERAEGRARKLLDQWEGSAAARQALVKIKRRRRQQAAEEQLRRAGEAMAREDFTEAARLYEAARALGADAARVSPGLGLAAARAEERSERERLEASRAAAARVVDALAGDRMAGLTAYAEAGAGVRSIVRAAADLAPLGWIDEMGPAASPARVAAAARALAAEEERSADDPAAVLERLAPHRELLQGVGRGRRLVSRVEAAAARARQAAARAAMVEAREALAAGDLPRARSSLRRADRGELAEEDRRQAREVGAALERAEELAALADRLDGLMEAGDLLRARAAAQRGVNLSSGEERRSWSSRLDGVREELHRQWRVQMDAGEGDDLRDFNLGGVAGTAAPILTSGGDRMLAVTGEGPWVFIREVEVDPVRVVRRVMFRAPWPAPRFCQLSATEGFIRIMSAGGVLRLDARSLDVVDSFEVIDHVHPEEMERGVKGTLRGRYLWLFAGKTLAGGGRCVIVDLDRDRVVRQIDDLANSAAIVGGGRRAFLGQTDTTDSSALDPRGQRLPGATLPVGFTLSTLAIHPDGEGLAALHLDEFPGEATRLMFSAFAADGGAAGPLVLEDARPQFTAGLATSRDSGRVYALIPAPKEHDIIAFEVDGDEIHQLYRQRVPRQTILALDHDSRQVAAVAAVDDGIQVAPLGQSPPMFGSSHDNEGVGQLPRFTIGSWQCGSRQSASVRVRELARQLRGLDGPGARGLVDGLKRDRRENQTSPQDLAAALHLSGRVHLQEHSEPRWEHDPAHPPAALAYAHILIHEERWEEIRQILEPLDAGRLDPGARQHRLHLLGMAAYRLGELEDALALWRAGAEIPGGSCVLDNHIDLALAVMTPGGGGQGASLVTRMVHALVRADQRLEAGDVAGVIEAVDTPATWRLRELQGLARLAEAHLRKEACTPDETWNKTLALAAFLERRRPALRVEHVTYNLPIPGHGWGADRLDEVADRAMAWLERDPSLDD